MEDVLELFGLISGVIGTVVLGICAPASLIRRPDGSLSMGGDRPKEERVRAYHMEKRGVPIGWWFMAVGFALQLTAHLVKMYG